METKPKLKTARRLHDTSKLVNRSDRPTNVYKELVTDDETGISEQFIWYTTELGNYVWRISLDRFNDLTQEKIEEGFEYTMPYSEKAVKEVLAKSFGNTKFYQKDGENTVSIANKADF